MRYAVACFQKEQADKAYRIYTSECLRLIVNNTIAPGGRYLDLKLSDILNPKKEETRTAEEIINHMKGRLNRLAGD